MATAATMFDAPRRRDGTYGGMGNDVVAGGAGMDIIFGDDGDDVIAAGKDGGFVSGGTGTTCTCSMRVTAPCSWTTPRA